MLADPIHADAEAWLRARCTIVRPAPDNTAELGHALATCDGVIVRTSSVTGAAIQAGTRLRVIAKHGSGTDNIDVATASRMGVCVTSCPGKNAPAVAEFTVACLFLLRRPVIEGDRWLRETQPEGSLVVATQRAGLVGHEIGSTTVGVLGWGEIGRRVGLATKALGGSVVVFDPWIPSPQIVTDGVSVAGELRELLAVSDVVTVHVPLTPDTRNLIGPAEFAGMQRGASFINTARGGIVDETALAEALRTGHLHGAAVDVFATEPPSLDNPLMSLPNVICTPHMAGLTDESLRWMGLCSAKAVIDVLGGRRPEHVVNAELMAVSDERRRRKDLT